MWAQKLSGEPIERRLEGDQDRHQSGVEAQRPAASPPAAGAAGQCYRAALAQQMQHERRQDQDGGQFVDHVR